MRCSSAGFVIRGFACGRCTACKINRSSEWRLRLLHESSYHDQASFLTLTFSDEFLPADMSVSRRDVQLFLKRFRKSLSPRKIKYYAVGEYGEQTTRPHYHFIVFGVSTADFDRTFASGPKFARPVYCSSSWPYGHIDVGSVTAQSILYVTKYLHKVFYGDRISDEYGTRAQPFALMSQGMGRQWCIDNAAQIVAGNLYYKGNPVPIPQYYQTVLKSLGFTLDFSDRIMDNSNERHDSLMEKCPVPSWNSSAIEDWRLELAETREAYWQASIKSRS